MTIECDGHGCELGKHCCNLGPYGVCPHLVINENAQLPDRKFVCSLREREGSWAAVYQTTEYQTDVQPFFDWAQQQFGASWNIGCGAWISQAEINEALAAHQQGDDSKTIGLCCYRRKILET